MLWLRVLRVAWRLSWPHVLTPWCSPLLRWRMETYGITDEQGRLLHAEQLTAAQCFTFACRNARALFRFLRWAAYL